MQGKKGYPSTPHLPFSPGVQADDTKLADDCPWLVGREIVVTEKLDGGNCCLWRGGVYARTHSHEATHPWFASIKALYPSFAAQVDDDLMLFGENMSAVHSIEYDGLRSHFYLFGVRRTSNGEWLAWDDVVVLAHKLELPHAPIWWNSTFKVASCNAKARQPSLLGRTGPLVPVLLHALKIAAQQRGPP